MLATLALVIFIGAIFVFFSQEFIKTFKKIFAIKGGKLLIPLAIASLLIVNFEHWCLWAIYYYNELLRKAIVFLTQLMPFQRGVPSIVLIVLLTMISIVPVFLLDIYLAKKTYKHYEYPYLTSTLIWVASAIILMVVA